MLQHERCVDLWTQVGGRRLGDGVVVVTLQSRKGLAKHGDQVGLCRQGEASKVFRNAMAEAREELAITQTLFNFQWRRQMERTRIKIERVV